MVTAGTGHRCPGPIKRSDRLILGPLAIIFGGDGLSNARSGAGHRSMAVWAIALGIVDLVLFAILIAVASRHGGLYIH